MSIQIAPDGIEALLDSLAFGGGAPVPWMGDWSAYTPIYSWSGSTASVDAGAWHTFLDITGEGWLTFVDAFNTTAGLPDVRITIDGVAILLLGLNGFDYNSFYRNGNRLLQPVPFKQSLKLEVCNNYSSTASVGCDYTYLLKNANPKPNNNTFLSASDRKMAAWNIGGTSYITLLDVAGSGYLVGISVDGMYTGGGSYVYLDLAVDGVTKISGRQVYYTRGRNQKHSLFLGPVRFTSSLTLRAKADSNYDSGVVRSWYTLD